MKILGLLLLGASLASGAWTSCRQLQPTTPPASTLTNFTVWVADTYTWMKASGSGGDLQDAQGDDFRFYSNSDCATGALKYQRISWNGTTGAVVIAVLVPSFTSSGTSIYIGTGDAGVTTDGSDGPNTWPSLAKAVFHLDDNAATTTVLDALGVGNLTNQSVTNSKTAAGRLGLALTYNGSTDYSSGASTATNAITNNFSVSAWLYRTSTSPSGEFWATKGRGGTSGWGLFTSSGTHQFVKFGVSVSNSSIASSLNTWEHIIWVVESSIAKLYKNGSLVYTSGDSSAIASSSNEFNIGLARDGTGAVDLTTAWPGLVDYLVVRSGTPVITADWAAAEYTNQSNPSGYWTVVSTGATRRRVVITQQ